MFYRIFYCTNIPLDSVTKLPLVIAIDTPFFQYLVIFPSSPEIYTSPFLTKTPVAIAAVEPSVKFVANTNNEYFLHF